MATVLTVGLFWVGVAILLWPRVVPFDCALWPGEPKMKANDYARIHAHHMHACCDCGREFYRCSERDCDIAPKQCRACELDQLDSFFSTYQAEQPSPKDLNNETF